MKRKIFTFTAAAALAAVLIVPASAAENNNCGQLPPDCPIPEFICQFICQHPCIPDVPEHDETPPVPEIPDQEEPPSVPETPEQEETPSVPETPEQEETPDANVMLQLEQAAGELVNVRRTESGLKPLTISADLSVKARIKSRDMKENGYFDHNSPTYGSPFALMQSLGITYRSAAENIAMGYRTAEAVVNAWMNSPGHRANILSANYTTMGIGFVDGYWTQWFIG